MPTLDRALWAEVLRLRSRVDALEAREGGRVPVRWRCACCGVAHVYMWDKMDAETGEGLPCTMECEACDSLTRVMLRQGGGGLVGEASDG